MQCERTICERASGRKARLNVSQTRCSITPSDRALSRREALQLSVAFAAFSCFPKAFSLAGTASPEKLGEIVHDELHGFAYRPPAEGWTRQTATISSARVATIYVRDADGDTNINVVTTSVSSDFQALTSFGGLDKVVVCLL